uniref:Si:ch211-149b19.3 n=1 Tax=Sinocyclocheilus anshuiensis TaxID=1608454 RepID=A0A671LDG5_9TELE
MVKDSAARIELGRSFHQEGTFNLKRRSLAERNTRCACMCDPTMPGVRWNSTRLDADGSGRPATWDSFGIWDNRIEEPILLPPSIRYGTPIPQISLSKVGCASHIGRRHDNEDRFPRPQAADFCHKHMEQHIRDCLEVETDLQAVLSKAFLQVDAALAAELQMYASLMMVGTTATVALLRDGIELVVASVGDSRALLCRKGKARKLTDDHTPERKDEKHRIRQSGGLVTWNSVGQANVNGRLAMTRSIGDFDLKKSGVIAEPETTLTLALQYGSGDNSTVIVVPFGAWGKHQNAEYTYDMSRNFASIGRWS